jgi:hypothetical protein
MISFIITFAINQEKCVPCDITLVLLPATMSTAALFSVTFLRAAYNSLPRIVFASTYSNIVRHKRCSHAHEESIDPSTTAILLHGHSPIASSHHQMTIFTIIYSSLLVEVQRATSTYCNIVRHKRSRHTYEESIDPLATTAILLHGHLLIIIHVLFVVLEVHTAASQFYWELLE